MFNDLRFAARALVRHRSFALGAVLTLALGIGVNTTVFTLANGALLSSRAGITSPDRVVWVSGVFTRNDRLQGMSYPDFLDYKARTADVFEEMAGFRKTPISLASGGPPERIRGEMVTGSFFPMLGVRAVAGRLIGAADDVNTAPPVVVVSERLWKQRFGGTASIVNQTIVLNGREYGVIGVAAAEFTGPSLGDEADVWVPMARWPDVRMSERALLSSRDAAWLSVLGRLRHGVTEGQAQAVAAAVASGLSLQYPADRERGVFVGGAGSPISPEGRDDLLPTAIVLFLLSGFVLVIACANLANLLLARGAARLPEMAIRASIGASRGRLIRQLLTESALLAAVGALCGLLLAFWASDLLVSMTGPELAGIRTGVDWRILLYTVAITAGSVCVFGIVPAFATTAARSVASLRSRTGGPRSRMQRAFVVTQLALSLVLLLGAGLSLRLLQKLSHVDLGFTSEHLTVASYDLVLQNYSDARRQAFRRELLAAVGAIPGVRSAALANLPPLSGTMVGGTVSRRGASDALHTFFNSVGPRYFSTLEIPILRGREFTDEDRQGAPRTAIINQTLARRLFDTDDPVGRQLTVASSDSETVTVIGVARDAKYDEASERATPFVYLSLAQEQAIDRETVVVRTSGADATDQITTTIRRLDPALPVFDVHPFARILRDRSDKQRVLSVVFTCFGGLALGLAAIGLYGVIAHVTVQRTRELGIRLALGATRGHVAGLIAREGIALGLLGTAAGLVLAVPLVKILGVLVFGIAVGDAAVFAMVAGLLNAVGLTAALLPARRAARLEPMDALRNE